MKGRGIDNSYERNKIEYSPKITHSKKPSQYVEMPTETEIAEIQQYQEYSVSATYEMLNEAELIYKDCVQIIIDKLQTSSVPINEDSPAEVFNLYKNNSITFNDYSKAVVVLSENELDVVANSVVKQYEQYHAEADKIYEGILYRAVINEQQALTGIKKFLVDLIKSTLSEFHNELMGKVDSYGSDFIKSYEENFMKQWEEVKIKKAKKEEEIAELEVLASDSETVAEEYEEKLNELEEIQREVRRFELNPIASIGKTYYSLAETSKTGGEKLFATLTTTIFDDFDESLGYLVKKLLKKLDIDAIKDRKVVEGKFAETIKEIKARLEKEIEGFEAIKKLLKLVSAAASFSFANLVDILESTINKAIASVMPVIINKFTELISSISKPVLNWLEDKKAEDDLFSLLPFDNIADLLVDALEKIDTEFKDFVGEFFKISFSKYKQFDQSLDLAKQRKLIGQIYQIIDKVQQFMKDAMNKLEYLSEYTINEIIISFMDENGWNIRYNGDTKEFEKIDYVPGLM